MKTFRKSPVVDFIKFDFTYKGVTVPVTLDLTIENTAHPEIFSPSTKDEVFSPDAPWCSFDLPDGSVMDFQVNDYDEDGILEVDACLMYEEGGVWHHGDFLDIEEYKAENISLFQKIDEQTISL